MSKTVDLRISMADDANVAALIDWIWDLRAEVTSIVELRDGEPIEDTRRE